MPSKMRSPYPNEMSDDFKVVGHVPKLMAIWLAKFLKRATNIGKVVIKGKRVNTVEALTMVWKLCVNINLWEMHF